MLTGRSNGGADVTSSPPISTLPAFGDSSPAMIRSIVVLPHPEPPSRATNSPRAIVSETLQKDLDAAERTGYRTNLDSGGGRAAAGGLGYRR